MSDSSSSQQDRSSSEGEEIKEVGTDFNRPIDLAALSTGMKRKIDSIYFEDELQREESKDLASNDDSRNQNANVDIFGFSLTSKKHLTKLTVNCPHCGRKVGALRFTYHLARCMKTGSGRYRRRPRV